MKDLAAAFLMSVSFFTALPAPTHVEWTKARIRWLPLMLPFAGLLAGLAVWLSACLLLAIPLGVPLKAALLTICWNAATGGLHLDAWMDAADGFFSRRDREERLRIMSDPATGAFGVMAAGMLFLLQYGMMQELLEQLPHLTADPAGPVGPTAPYAAALPFFLAPFLLSRTGAAWMIYFLPFAKKEGLAAMYRDTARKSDAPWLSAPLALAIGVAGMLGVSEAGVVLAVLIAFAALAGFSSTMRRHFGGITGDLLGAYITGSEALALLALLVGRSLWS